MRLLLVSQEFPPETGWGGIGRYADVLSEALAGQGTEVHVLSVVPGQAPSDAVVRGAHVHRRGLRRPRGIGRATRLPQAWQRATLAVEVARLVHRLPVRPTSVECPEWQAEGLGLALRGTVPLVVRLHSSARQLFPFTGQGRGLGGLDGRLAGWMEDASARSANVVTSTRSNLADVAGPLGLDPAALCAIPQPVRLPARAPLPVGESPRILFFGRLEPRKGPEVLVQALPAVRAAVPGARLVLAGRDGVASGEPSSRAWLEREAARLGVAGALEFTGHLDTPALQAEIARARVCAFPSRWESFGSVVAEAAAVGRPVVTSTIPPFDDLVRDGVTGRRVPAGDVDGWAAALTEALRDPGRAADMGTAGADLVAALCDPARVAAQTVEAHELAVERHARGLRAGRGQPRRRRR